MLVHLICRPLTHTSHIPASGIRLLAEGLRSAGHAVVEDNWAIPSGDLAASVAACALELRETWREQEPDIVHTAGLVATMAAIEAGGRAPIVATFDEQPLPPEAEDRVAGTVAAVVPMSRAERDRLRRRGVRTLWTGSFPFPVPVPDPDACAASGGAVVTVSGGRDLDDLVSSMPFWVGRLVVATRLPPARMVAVRTRSLELGVADRVDLRPGLRGAAREQMWSEAAVLVAGHECSRHGGPVLEAAARGVPAIAVAVGAHKDHVIPGVTGVLLDPTADPRTLGRAIAQVTADTFGLRAMGTSALVRVRTLYAPALAGQRVMSLYREVLPQDAAADSLLHRSPGARSDADRNTLAVENLALARQLAGWYAGRGQSREDLVQVASLGLVRAAERFDPGYGKEFHSFAIPTILGELRKHFRDHAWAVRVPRSLQEATLQVQRASEQIQQAEGHDATATDLAAHLGLAEEEVVLAMRADGEARSSHSLDHQAGDDGSVADMVGDLDPALDNVELSHDVHAALARMPEREQRILLMRFYGDRTQAEIAERLGISQVHVSRVLARTLAAVRDHVLDDVPLPQSWEPDPAAGIPASRHAS